MKKVRERKNHERVIKAVEVSVLRSLSYCISWSGGLSAKGSCLYLENKSVGKETETKAILIETLQYINSSIFFRLLWTLVMGTGLIFQYYYILMHFNVEELPNLIDSLSTALPYSLFFFKLIILWTNNRYVLPTTL